MKKSIVPAALVLVSQFAFGSNSQYQISKKCISKISSFASVFGQVSMMDFGGASASVGRVTIDQSAELIGESGFANGKGSFEVVFKDGTDVSTQVQDFEFLFATEPHCAVMKIKMSNVP
jgi:hypothetical protein